MNILTRSIIIASIFFLTVFFLFFISLPIKTQGPEYTIIDCGPLGLCRDQGDKVLKDNGYEWFGIAKVIIGKAEVQAENNSIAVTSSATANAILTSALLAIVISLMPSILVYRLLLKSTKSIH